MLYKSLFLLLVLLVECIYSFEIDILNHYSNVTSVDIPTNINTIIDNFQKDLETAKVTYKENRVYLNVQTPIPLSIGKIIDAIDDDVISMENEYEIKINYPVLSALLYKYTNEPMQSLNKRGHDACWVSAALGGYGGCVIGFVVLGPLGCAGSMAGFVLKGVACEIIY